MTPREQKLARRRDRVREMRDEGLSVREIAARLDVGRSTVSRDLTAAPGPERGEVVPNAAGPGNDRALKHGVYSESRIAPVRERHGRVLAERYPDLDPGRRATEAQRRAMIELASAWIDEKGTVVRDGEGRTFDIAVKLAGWLMASERWMERVAEELRRPDAGGGLEALIARGQEIIDAREVDDGE